MPINPDSILDSVKKALGIDYTDTTFDLDVTMFTNAAFGSLKQLGVGSDTGFMISDNTTTWFQYVTNLAYLGMVKSFVVMSVKIVFDPPESRTGLPAVKQMLEELAWRINIEAEHINPPDDPFGATVTTEFESGVMKAAFSPKVVQLPFASVVTPDASAGNMFYLTLTADCIINAPVNGADGQHITLEITSNGHSASWRNGWNFGSAGNPVLSGGSASDIVSAYYKQTQASWRSGFTPGF